MGGQPVGRSEPGEEISQLVAPQFGLIEEVRESAVHVRVIDTVVVVVNGRDENLDVRAAPIITAGIGSQYETGAFLEISCRSATRDDGLMPAMEVFRHLAGQSPAVTLEVAFRNAVGPPW